MESSRLAKLQAELIQWCRGEGINIKYAILVVGVSEHLAVGQIEDALHTVRCWGRVGVRSRKFISDDDRLLVLCECKEEINPLSVPPEVTPTAGDVWKIVVADPVLLPPAPSDTGDFSAKLRDFLTAEGKTLADLQGLCSPSVPPCVPDESVLRAMVDVVSRANKSH